MSRNASELGMPYVYDPSQQIVRLTGDDLRCGHRRSAGACSSMITSLR